MTTPTPITKENAPYEFLVRWKDGRIESAQVRFAQVIKEGDEVLKFTIGEPQSVALGDQAGFPLADVLRELDTASLGRIDDLEKEVVALVAQKTIATDQLAAAETRAATAESRLASLESIQIGLQAHVQRLNEQATAPAAETSSPVPVSSLNPHGVPSTVSMKQARLALLAAGLLDTVDAEITGMEGAAGAAARIEWNFSTEITRSNALVAQLGQALGLSDERLDGLFIAASRITDQWQSPVVPHLPSSEPEIAAQPATPTEHSEQPKPEEHQQ